MRSLTRSEPNVERQSDAEANGSAGPSQVISHKELWSERVKDRQNDAANQMEAPGQLAFPGSSASAIRLTLPSSQTSRASYAAADLPRPITYALRNRAR